MDGPPAPRVGVLCVCVYSVSNDKGVCVRGPKTSPALSSHAMGVELSFGLESVPHERNGRMADDEGDDNDDGTSVVIVGEGPSTSTMVGAVERRNGTRSDDTLTTRKGLGKAEEDVGGGGGGGGRRGGGGVDADGDDDGKTGVSAVSALAEAWARTVNRGDAGGDERRAGAGTLLDFGRRGFEGKGASGWGGKDDATRVGEVFMKDWDGTSSNASSGHGSGEDAM